MSPNLERFLAIAYLQVVGRYKATRLGFAWSFVKPMMQFVFFFIIFGFLIKASDEPLGIYAIKLYLGLSCWWLWAEGTSAAMHSIAANPNFVVHVKIPLYTMPLAAVMSAWINHVFTFLVFLIAYLIYSANSFTQDYIFLSVYGYFLLVVVTLLIGCLLAYLATMYRDVIQVWDILLFYAVFFCPIIYAPAVPERFKLLYYLAIPIAYPLECIKAAFFGKPPDYSGSLAFNMIFLAELGIIAAAVVAIIQSCEGRVRDSI